MAPRPSESASVRAYIGYDRLDTVQQTCLLNAIYEKLWLYHNLFLPVQRTVQKIPLPSSPGASKMKRVYDEARPPLERPEKTRTVPPQRLNLLKQLREEIYDLIDRLFSLPGARPTITEDIPLTLGLPSSLPEALLSPVTLSFDLTTLAAWYTIGPLADRQRVRGRSIPCGRPRSPGEAP